MELLLVLIAMAADDSVRYPQPILRGSIEVTPAVATISKVPLMEFGETGLSEGEHFVLGLRLRNNSSTKRVDFDGWPEQPSFRGANFTVVDEHGNKYKSINFGALATKVGDDSGKTIEPNSMRGALVVCEKPIPLAMKLTIDLDGKAIGQPGTRLTWTIERKDWEAKKNANQGSRLPRDPLKP